MNRITRVAAIKSMAIVLALGVPGCANKKAGEKTTSAPEAPPSAGYEAALSAHGRKPVFMPTGTAPAVWGPGDLYSLLATGKETNNTLFQFEAIVPEGGGPPAHVHSREDESFYIVSGTLEIVLGDKIYQSKRGDFVYIPRGTVHRFKNVGRDTAVQLVTFVPAGMEGFFQEVFPEVKDRDAAPPPVTEELIKRMNEAAPKYGLEFVPPPEGAKP
jgi:mannose-6-phosphate isomerase-like protein (cupin superfamily)